MNTEETNYEFLDYLIEYAEDQIRNLRRMNAIYYPGYMRQAIYGLNRVIESARSTEINYRELGRSLEATRYILGEGVLLDDIQRNVDFKKSTAGQEFVREAAKWA